jgi:hypothetical protein
MDNEPLKIDYKEKQVFILMLEGEKWFLMEKDPGMLVPVDQNGFILFKEEFEMLMREVGNFFT